MIHVKHPKHAERRLAMVFGWEATKTILKVIEEGQIEEVFGSRANLIKKIVEGEISELNKVSFNLTE
ncbi:MAG: hypothetical protein HYY67_08240 [Thaumarchaeota archaeon]|nr:hypothetical protein [Nitrososphaerota archaeon]